MTVNLLERDNAGHHKFRAKAPGKKDERTRAPVNLESREWLFGGAKFRLPKARMSLFSFRQSAINFFKPWVLLNLGNGTVERSAVELVLPIGYILRYFVGVRHQSAPARCDKDPLTFVCTTRAYTKEAD